MDFQAHRIKTDDATLVAEIMGASADPPVLLIAGTSCTRDWWPPEFCRQLAASHCRVIRYDQRDTGESSLWPVGEPGYTLEDLMGDAVAILDFFGYERSHVVGFSQGGWVAQLLALEHPHRVSSMTLISSRSTDHGPADPDLPEVSDGLLAAWGTISEPDWDDEAAVIDYYVENERILAGDEFDADAARQICARAVARSVDARTAGNHPYMQKIPRWRERLSEIQVPTTVFHGALDPLFPLENGSALAREMPGASFTVLDGIGHEFPKRAWPQVVDDIRRRVRSQT
ncbi:alpha/beta fold hydrolase [Microbacterium sp. HD4P20]|uniref:alpha/beta fold hydrolase n=1 Tax=Microbacterium sp. HD4P20 TaxID=2864874 RepID=UPI001C63F7F6|nr:alpha/beta hydrolase [Microbacterium sp. HD4P20]MCP2637653.1 alpha/beta fold hydrolase [Microbacterium sp. HD4P20]